MVESVDELRLEAAKAARRIADMARLHDDVRVASTTLRVRYGGGTLFDIAETQPQAVIDFAEGIDALVDVSEGDEIPRWMR